MQGYAVFYTQQERFQISVQAEPNPQERAEQAVDKASRYDGLLSRSFPKAMIPNSPGK